MEVHHPHHPSHKKKWSEYIIEFVMLFAAVTLGFFAENVREHKIMIERKDQNLFSILQDLKQDSIYLVSTIKYSDDGIRYFQKLKAKLYEFHDNKLSENEFIKFTLDNVDSSYLNQTVFLNSSSYNNMIATGNLTYVESKDLKWKLSNYYETWNKRIDVNGDEIDNVNNYLFLPRCILHHKPLLRRGAQRAGPLTGYCLRGAHFAPDPRHRAREREQDARGHAHDGSGRRRTVWRAPAVVRARVSPAAVASRRRHHQRVLFSARGLWQRVHFVLALWRVLFSADVPAVLIFLAVKDGHRVWRARVHRSFFPRVFLLRHHAARHEAHCGAAVPHRLWAGLEPDWRV